MLLSDNVCRWSKYLFCTVFSASSVLASPLSSKWLDNGLEPVLTTIGKTSELSIFYSLFNGTGGVLGIPGPALEERFNDPNNSLSFTIFAPTNDAFANVSQETLAALTAPTSYQLLYSLLINHIAPGAWEFSGPQHSESVHAVGGFDIGIDGEGNLRTNMADNTTWQASLVQDRETGRVTKISASNGVIYPIDHVLDGYLTYFGTDTPSSTDGYGKEGRLPDIVPLNSSGSSMRDILQDTPELSTLHGIWKTMDSDFLERLSLYSSSSNKNESHMADHHPDHHLPDPETLVYLAPSNTAFSYLPHQSVSRALQPSNNDLTEFLLGFGLGKLGKDTDSSADNESYIFTSSQSQFRVKMRGNTFKNARVEERICAGNGCVYLVGRWVDPLFGLL